MLFFNPNKSASSQAINEVYFGKSHELKAMENQLDKFRNKYMSRYVLNMHVNSDHDLLEFDRMVENFFGFGCFTLHIHNQAIANAFTMPVDYRFDYKFNNNDLLADRKTFKFKKEADYCVIVGIYSGIIFNPEFTTEEVMACIMHEIGHNFNASISSLNGTLAKNYISLILAIELVQTFSGAFNTELITNNNFWRVFIDKTVRKWRNNSSAIITVYDILQQMKMILYAAANFGTDIANVLTLGLLTPIFAILNGLLNILFTSGLDGIISSIIKIFSLSARVPDEQAADNFATMYGYGPATISLQQKLGTEAKDNASVVMRNINKIPIIAPLIHLNELPGFIILGLFDEHPEAMIRCKDQLNLLKNEVNKNDLDPKMRKIILADIAECEKQMVKLTKVTSAIEDPYAARKAYNAQIAKLKGDGPKVNIFGNKDKFNQYDLSYIAASKENNRNK